LGNRDLEVKTAAMCLGRHRGGSCLAEPGGEAERIFGGENPKNGG
jgi:hypothetical protein